MSAQFFPVTSNTQYVGPGSTFVAIKGFKNDGAMFIPQALAQGATKIVIHKDCISDDLRALCKQHGATVEGVDDTRKAFALLSAEASDHAHKKLKIIGITGTKGKTTTSFLLHHIIQSSGLKCALISTIYTKVGNTVQPSERTTPEADYLHVFFKQCVDQNVEYVVMEVSSHALSLDRVYGIEFTAGGFTNLGNDHLDFHETMENYLDAKMQLFERIKNNGVGVFNADNEWCMQGLAKITKQKNCTFVTIGQEKTSTADNHYRLSIIDATCDGVEACIMLQPPLLVESRELAGVFNAYNIAIAASICKHLDIPYTHIARGVSTFKGVPGRMQKHTLENGARAFVDFAHEATSTEAILNLLRPFTTDLIVVFGCGGDRNPQRRPAMGSCAARFGDRIVITSDNPRTENPTKIIDQILDGIDLELRGKVEVIQDRAEAIAHAAKIAKPHSIIALLGKGHERYQIIGSTHHHFDDFEEISQF